MATITHFEDVEGWKKARELARAVYQAAASTPVAKDFGLHDQMQRAAVSVMANIAEGFGRGGNKEFILSLGHARGSWAELKSHFMWRLTPDGSVSRSLRTFINSPSEAEGLVSGFMKYLQNSEARGRKFKKMDNREP